jgi:hypothetical protein
MVGTWRFYTDPLSPVMLLDIFTGNLANWYIHWPIYEDARIDACPYAEMLRNHKERLIVL